VRLTRQDLQRIRHRHFGYRITLVVQLALLLLLPLSQRLPWLLSLMLCLLALVLMMFLSRYSVLRRTRPLVYGLGGLALLLEFTWHIALVRAPAVAAALTFPHVLVWVLFLVSVVLGAASGYLTLGIAGGLLLTTLWVVDPAGFLPAALPAVVAGQSPVLTAGHALMAAAFGLLTTVGTGVLSPASVPAQVLATVITVSGQLYVAILIALILGRVHRRLL
jgi:hypothetical protein